MEMASYLAGERWSDHPRCTHPLLAAVARNVNDLTSDDGRQRLTVLIPSVIGLTSDDPHVDARIALSAATLAMPVVASSRQTVMAVGILSSERVLAELDGRPADSLSESSQQALESAPHAAQWARRFYRGIRASSVQDFRKRAAPSITRCATEGIALSTVPDPDALLHEVLVTSIRECEKWVDPVEVDHRTPQTWVG
jgi:hypothetical protein